MTFKLELTPAEAWNLSIVTGEYILRPDIPDDTFETTKSVDAKLKRLLKEWERETITIPRSALVKVLNHIQEGYEEYTETLESGARFEDAMNEAWDLLKRGGKIMLPRYHIITIWWKDNEIQWADGVDEIDERISAEEALHKYIRSLDFYSGYDAMTIEVFDDEEQNGYVDDYTITFIPGLPEYAKKEER